MAQHPTIPPKEIQPPEPPKPQSASPTILNATPAPSVAPELPKSETSSPKSDESEGSDHPFPPITRKNFYAHPVFWARFLGYAIPIGFLLYVLYINYLPFGYHKRFTINVGSPNDLAPSEFQLELSKDLSDRMTNGDGSTYRELNGTAMLAFKPRVPMDHAEITVEVQGSEGVSLIPPQITFNPAAVSWDFDWDFTKGPPKGLASEKARAFAYEDGTFFDGSARLEMASSSNMFEEGPFTVFAEWTPTDEMSDYQEIVGHFNWELFQNKNNISFRLGRMNNANGEFYALNYKIDAADKFFNKKHTCIVSYVPDPKTSKGYVEMYVDGRFVDRKPIYGDVIFKEYNSNINLSFGKSQYNVANYFSGKLHHIRIMNASVLKTQRKIVLSDVNENALKIQLISSGTSTITAITLNANR